MSKQQNQKHFVAGKGKGNGVKKQYPKGKNVKKSSWAVVNRWKVDQIKKVHLRGAGHLTSKIIMMNQQDVHNMIEGKHDVEDSLEEEEELSREERDRKKDGYYDLQRSAITMRQIVVNEHPVEIDPDKWIALSYAYPLFATSRLVARGETIEVSPGQFIGVHYLMGKTLLFDLWGAALGRISIFGAMPIQYWELRQALTPSESPNGESYRFIVGENFDDMFPAYPLKYFGSGISWVTDPSTVQATMNTVLPVITTDQLTTVGIKAVSRIMTELAKAGHSKELIEEPKTPYDESIAAFAIPQFDSFNGAVNFATISDELYIQDWEKWLSKLALAADSSSAVGKELRRGRHRDAGIVGTCHFSMRIERNISGKQKACIPMPKYFSLSDFVTSILTTVLQADVYQSEINTDTIVQDTAKSMLAKVTSGEFLFSLYQAISNRFAATSWIFFDAPIREDFPVLASGVQNVPTYESLMMMIPAHVMEDLAAISPFSPEKESENREYYAYYPVLTMNGTKLRANPFESSAGGSPTDIASLIDFAWPPKTGGGSTNYDFKITTTQVPDFMNFEQFVYSNVDGSGFADAIDNVAYIMATLQGNMLVAPANANDHTWETLLYYTKQIKIDRDGAWDGSKTANLLSFSNRYPFSPDLVTSQLSRILPMAPVAAADPGVFFDRGDNTQAYRSVFHEITTLKLEVGEDLLHRITQIAVAFAHEVAGMGSATSLSDYTRMAQHKGGLFLGALKAIGKTLLPIGAKIISGMLGTKVREARVRIQGRMVSAVHDHPRNFHALKSYMFHHAMSIPKVRKKKEIAPEEKVMVAITNEQLERLFKLTGGD